MVRKIKNVISSETSISLPILLALIGIVISLIVSGLSAAYFYGGLTRDVSEGKVKIAEITNSTNSEFKDLRGEIEKIKDNFGKKVEEMNKQLTSMNIILYKLATKLDVDLKTVSLPSSIEEAITFDP